MHFDRLDLESRPNYFRAPQSQSITVMSTRDALAPLRTSGVSSNANRGHRKLAPPFKQELHAPQESQPQTRQKSPPRMRVIPIDRPQSAIRARAAAAEPPTTSVAEQLRARLTELHSARRLRSASAEGDSENTVFVDNVVVSAKYTALNFVPRVLLAQVQRPSNLYFLFIAVLQTIKDVSNTNGVPTILLPLTFVFVCSAIKEALEDRARHRADAVMNSQSVLRLSAYGAWEQRQWGEIRVGDIVKVLNDETVPADLFMLSAEELEDATMDADATSALAAVSQTHAQKEEAPSVVPLHRPSGNLAYIETKSLDGETNLKIRTAIPLVAALTAPSCGGLNRLRGVIECEPPNNRIAMFDGTFSLSLDAHQAAALGVQGVAATDDNDATSAQHHALQQVTHTLDGSYRVRVPITAKQMVLRSCVLRNTRAVVGVAIFTGHETKVFCSNTEPVVKTSSVEQRLNALIIGVVCIQQLVCLLGALLGALWMVSQGNAYWYLRSSAGSAPESAGFPFRELLKLHLRYFIIMQNFVPISLNVSLEFVKYWQAYFIEQDLDMYDAASDTPALVRSSALNEDLGRVHHIFTDKTGTLTMNLMLFRFCMIDGKHYGGDVLETDDDSTDATTTTTRITNSSTPFVRFDPTALFTDLQAGSTHAMRIQLFLRHLALCHTLLPAKPFAEMCASATPEYSASSPDEQALVAAAAHCNVRFVHRTPSALVLLEPGFAHPRVYTLLNVLEFDSDRKRMTVIVETPEREIQLLCKGADNVIFERLAAEQASDAASIDDVYAQLSEYAQCGLRTLCIAYKTIDRAEYEAWNRRFAAATVSMDELVKRRQGLPNAIDPLMHEIELDLHLLGVTAVQDKLQDGVPKTLELLRQTRMKVWTLTGDKMETAINIGYACSLLTSEMEVVQVASDEYIAVAKGLQEVAMRQERLSAASNDTRAAKRHHARRRQASHAWHERLRASVRTLVLGAPPSTKRTRTRKAPAARRALTYSPVSTVGRDDAGSGTGDNGGDDAAVLRRGPFAGFDGAGRHASPSIALVIDGKALEHALRPRLRPLFYQVTTLCSSVICCRVSPKQKADIVEFVRHFEPESITLAIGDGANDVGMIQAAHVGVGISGQEGMQAVNSSDYAIGQFRFLQRLLFVHGRWAYRRVAKLMSYMLYKNVTYVLTTFWFGCFCGFSGQPLILDVAAQSFNVLYTSLPLVLFAVFDQDVSSASAAKFPYLYSLGQSNVLLARRVFWPWILTGIWHSVVIFFVSAWGFQGDLSVSTHDVAPHHPVTVSSTGLEGGLVTLGFVVFTNLVIVVNLKLVLETFMVTWYFATTVLASITLWFGVGALLSSPTSRFRHAVGEMTFLLQLPAFWALCLLVVMLSLLRDVLWKIIRRMNFPSTYHILQEREKLRMANSPRSMASEYNAVMWPDVQVPVLDYAKVLRQQLPSFESAHESFRRSSPLAESLISSGSQDSDGSPHIRARASFHVVESRDDAFGAWEHEHELHPLIESAPGVAQTVSPSSGVGGGGAHGTPASNDAPRLQYHGYAFSQDENVDSDVEAASVSSSKEKYDRASLAATSGLASPLRPGSSRSFKKMLKSVRGQKNA